MLYLTLLGAVNVNITPAAKALVKFWLSVNVLPDIEDITVPAGIPAALAVTTAPFS